MSLSGLLFDPMHMFLCALTCTSQPEMLPSHGPTQGTDVFITQPLISILLLVD